MQVLETPSGRLVRSLYAQGCKLAAATRGWATLHDIPDKPYKCIAGDFELITFDIVINSSTKGAWLWPCADRYTKPIPKQAAAQAYSRFGVGSVPAAHLGTLPEPSKANDALNEFVQGLQVRVLFYCRERTGQLVCAGS